MEKINVAELLKDCPKGMELDCIVFTGLEFDHIDENNVTYPIICRVKTEIGSYNIHTFTEYGCYSAAVYSKCVIFPKGKTTWAEFVPPCKFKDGDIIYVDNFIAIFSNVTETGTVWYHCYYCIDTETFKAKRDFGIGKIKHGEFRLATEEEKQKLFQVIKDNGYKWNEKTKTLEKLIEPKFKVGDRIKYKNGIDKNGVEQGVILSITNEAYDVAVTNDMGIFVPIANQDNCELVPNKFDINTLNPFDKVLMRSSNAREWVATFYSHYSNNKFHGCGMYCDQCIPYKNNEHLLGTTNDCNDYYKNWE